jgi:predicted MFS family arabinose efflux permease
VVSEVPRAHNPVSTSLRRDLLLAAGLAAGPLAGVGLARFAYGLLLPPMRADLEWSYAQAGAMNTANALGYLLGALVSIWFIHRFGGRVALLGGLLATALALLACATTGHFAALLALRALAGVSGAVVFVAATGLAAAVGARRTPAQAAVLVGLSMSGAGTGIVLSGVTVGPLLGQLSADIGWRWGWLVLGMMAVLALWPAHAASRRIPPAPPSSEQDSQRRRQHRRLGATTLSYGLFGAGYIAYMTFIVALLSAAGASAVAIIGFWTVLGSAAAVATVAWGPILGRATGGRGLALLLVLGTVAAGLPLVADSTPAAYVSGMLAGASFMPVVGAVTAIARRTLPPAELAAAIGGLTVAFALGQTAGPVMAGLLSDAGGVRAGLALSVALLSLGALVALAQRHSPVEAR